MITKIAVALLMAVACTAADQPTPDSEVGIVEMKHLTGDRLRTLVDSLRRVQEGVSFDSNLNLVIIKGTPQQVAAIRSMLQRVDQPEPARRPEPQVQLRVHLIVASLESGKDTPVAPEIASAVEQMRKTFPYKSYSEMDTLVLQVRNQGSAGMNGLLPIDIIRPDSPSNYVLVVDNVTVAPDSGAVSLRNFRVNSRLAIGNSQGGINLFQAGINTDLTIQKGQKIVVGKLTNDQRKDAIFVVLAANVI